ncbi:hypothetical protein DFH06DRAFT_1471213 [Mycena polygramma]|nr:hypothetical protein DFH06DRAFT_1471213 [Mycena polygramma]
MLIGVFLNMILYGVLIGQLYKKDPTWIRCFVGFLFFVLTANTGLSIAMLYQPLILEYVKSYRSHSYLKRAQFVLLIGQKPVFFPTVFMTQSLSVVLVSMPIQLFFAFRIHKLTKFIWIPIIIALFAITSFDPSALITSLITMNLRSFFFLSRWDLDNHG